MTASGGADVADTGIASATVGRADVRVVRLDELDSWSVEQVPDRRFHMIFVLDGAVHASIGTREHEFSEADAAVVPVGGTAHLRGAPNANVLSVVIETD